MGENIRELALDSLIEIMENDKFSHIVINDVLTKFRYLDKKDRAFYTKIVHGTLENVIYIDYVIDLFSKTKTKKMKPLIRNLIRMSVYQIGFMDSVPVSAVCNEAVKLAGKRGFSGLKGFVNGVLRNISRNYDSINIPKDDEVKYLSIKYSFPEWIIKMWVSQYSFETTEMILEGFEKENKLCARINASKDRYEEIISSLRVSGVEVEAGDYVKESIKISGFDNLNQLEAFKKGEIYVQDESSMLVGYAAGVKKGDFVLDVCAAPGGKSLHIARLLDGTGYVQARDLSYDKVLKIKENIDRTNLDNIEAVQWDALELDEDMVDRADVLIADLPCAGLGIAGKKPDIRYKTSLEDVNELSKLQRQILDVVKAYVKPGGSLIYSTCSISEQENYENVKWFSENSDFELDSLNPYIPEVLHNEDTKAGFLRLFPGINKSDGFFIARFVRK